MKFNYLKMKGFKVYKDEVTFEFTEGVNLILAPNGSGKSCIIDAINLIMLDIQPDKNKKKLDLVNWDLKDRKFYIELEFEWDKVYKLVYKFDEKKTPDTIREVYIDGKFELDGVSQVVNYLSEMFDKKLIESALFSKQDKNTFVKVTDSERRELLRKIKDIDYDSKIKEIIDPEIVRIETNIQQIDKEIYALEHKEYEDFSEKILPFSFSQISDFEDEKKKLEMQLKRIQIIKEQAEDISTQINKVSEEISNKENKVSVNRQSISNNLIVFEKEVQAIETSIKNLNLSIKSYNDFLTEEYVEPDLSEYNVKIKEQENILGISFGDSEIRERYGNQILEVNNKIEDITKQIDGIKLIRISSFDDTALNNLKYKKQKLIEEQELMKGGKCPKCGRDFEEGYIHTVDTELSSIILQLEEETFKKTEHEKKVKDNNDAKDKKNKLKGERTLLVNKVSSLTTLMETTIKSEKNMFEEKRNSAKNIIESIEKQKEQVLESASKEFENKRESAMNNIQSLNGQISEKELQKVKESNRFQDDKTRIEKEIEDALFEIDKLKAEKSKLLLKQKTVESFDEDEEVKIEKRIKQININIQQYNLVIQYNEDVSIKKEEIETKKIADKTELEKKKKDKDKKNLEKLDYEKAKQLLARDFPNFIIGMEIEDLQNSINEFVDNTYSKSLDLILKSNKNSISLLCGKSKINASGALSGAERQITQIGFINNFNKKLDLQCIFLDEPDASVDDDNSAMFYEVLGEMAVYYKQMFIITHKKMMAEYLENNHDASVIRL